jgi:hypothetical protein
MEMIEKKTIVYDSNGYVETIVELVPKIEVDKSELIKSKEDELLSMYQELERLKALKL